MKTTKIVWNGCDSYIESDCAESRGYDFTDGKLYHGAHEYNEFDAVTETGRYYVGIDK